MAIEEKTIPEEYENLGDVMSNFDHQIDRKVEARLRKSLAWATYSGWNFNGRVWWDLESEQWACEVWQYHSHVETVYGETLDEIMEQICAKYGDD